MSVARCLVLLLQVPVLLVGAAVPLLAGGEGRSAGIERIAWLAGCWQRETEGRVTEERWTAPLGKAMLGVNRTVVGGRMVAHEFLRIEEQDGRLVLTAIPSGQRQASFTQIALTDSKVVFENPAHDFPNRIIYQRLPDGSLLGRIEGQRNGEPQGVDFPMDRTNCEPEESDSD